MSPNPLLDVYNVAASIRRRIKSHLHLPLAPRPPNHSPLPISPLDLQLPLDFQFAIADPELHPDVHALVTSQLTQLKRCYQQQYDIAARKFASSGIENSTSRLESLRTSLQRRFTDRAIPKLFEILKSSPPHRSSLAPNQARPPFHHKYTPLLEDFFEANPYPSKSQQSSLASQTKMTEKQIEIWFQNHRSRARKNCRVVSRPNTRSTPARSPSPDSPNPPTDNEQSPRWPLSPLTTPPPAQLLSISSSAATTRELLPPPSWARRPSTQPILHGAEINVEDLTRQFAMKLCLKDRRGKTKRSGSCERSSGHISAWSSIRVPLLPAPLPALVSRPAATCTVRQPLPRFRSKRSLRSPNNAFFAPYAKMASGNVFLSQNPGFLHNPRRSNCMRNTGLCKDPTDPRARSTTPAMTTNAARDNSMLSHPLRHLSHVKPSSLAASLPPIAGIA